MSDQIAAQIKTRAHQLAAQCLEDIEGMYGALAANAYAEGFLEASSKHFCKTLGPNAAFETFSRQADAILTAVAESGRR